MNMRKITSMTMLLSLIVLIINSIVLYVVPEGRVAYWADWRFLGLTKEDWGAQHTTVGFLFVFAGLLHLYYNWNPILAYMKNKARQIKVFTGPFNVALAITVIFVVGTYFHIPPMSTILEISGHFKNAASEKYGEPPYGHAESSSLAMFTKREGLDLETSLVLLKSAGFQFGDEKDTIKEIAATNEVSPQVIYEAIKPATIQAAAPAPGEPIPFPDAPQAGWGKKILADVCAEYDLDVNEIVAAFAARNIDANADMAIKDIAAGAEMEPMQLFEVLHEIVNNSDQ